MLTTPQLAERLGCSPQNITKYVSQGRMKPALTLPNGQHLWRENARLPKQRKRGRPKKASA